MTPTRFLLPIALVLLACGVRAGASEVKKVELVEYDTLRFSPSTIEAQPGQKVELTLKSESGFMNHKWVLLKPGIDLMEYSKQSLKAQHDKATADKLSTEILASSPLLGPKGSCIVTFTAPATPGVYSYICDCPLHATSGMKGNLVVK